MGDEDDEIDFRRYRHEPVYKEHLSVSSVFSIHKVLLPLFYAAAMLTCGSSFRTRSRLLAVAESVRAQVDFQKSQHAEALVLLEEVTQKEAEVTTKHNDLKSTSMKLRHELRMKEELLERVQGHSGKDAILEHLSQQHHQTHLTWSEQRKVTLLEKIQALQTYVREQSRQWVLAEYGPGPHRVEFHVQLPHKQGLTNKFLVELAPVDLMPHSNQIFLDMISNQAWDNTVFYHHINHAHVLAAAPVQYGTFEPKTHHWDALGYTGLSFPEYSNEWPHEEYTLGFSGKGPNFYINTMDNSEHHGPGGQDHHELKTDADPCFAKVVWGKQVIQEMMPIKAATGNENETPQSWDDFDVTHIVKVKLQNNNKNSVPIGSAQAIY